MESKKQNRWRRLIRKAANFMGRHNWHRGTLAKTKMGTLTRVLSDDAVSFCMLGALVKVSDTAKLQQVYGPWCTEISMALYIDLPHSGPKARYDTGDKVLDQALTEIARFHRVQPLYRINDNCAVKEEVINKLLAVANQ
jgi:hypothetical protein